MQLPLLFRVLGREAGGTTRVGPRHGSGFPSAEGALAEATQPQSRDYTPATVLGVLQFQFQGDFGGFTEILTRPLSVFAEIFFVVVVWY